MSIAAAVLGLFNADNSPNVAAGASAAGAGAGTPPGGNSDAANPDAAKGVGSTPASPPPSTNPSEDEPSQKNPNFSDKPSKIAGKLGVSEKAVLKAIEAVKQAARGFGSKLRPDVMIDLRTGEARPKAPGGRLGDSIGNIHDYLR